jgi:exodeoxyribonuclease V beta subunit
MQELAIDTFPLTGQRLIEASAGTGKTYTIAGLYLRLLLERQLTVTQLLVVTFTEAATQELRGRIRQRIYNALRFVEGKSEEDDFAAMLQPYCGNTDVIKQLRDAVTRMDEAAVFTIHGFCQRTLTDSAFESGVLFDAEFVTDESEIRGQIANDFWRRRVAETSVEHAAWVIAHWKTPIALFSDINALVGNPQVEVSPDVSQANIDKLEKRKQELFEQLYKEWPAAEPVVTALLMDSKLLSRGPFKKEILNALFAAMPGFVGSTSAPASLPPYFDLFTQTRISDTGSHKAAESKKGTPIPIHPFFAQADELAKVYKSINDGRTVLFMQEAAEYMRTELRQRKEKSRIMFFDDLLDKLDSALMGEGGAVLAKRIRQQYPVAMIDEFQDTDPTQYRIFNRIYLGQAECGLFMIGDPKQAIYSFRGADIFTYMQARHDTDPASGHFTLKTNYRSHSLLVSGVNALFGKAQAPFIYEGEIDFYDVDASGKADETPLLINGVVPAPLVCWHVPITEENRYGKTIPKTWAGQQVARGCAAEIARLLNMGQRGEAKIGKRNLAARDIAVLVRDRFEAANIRNALQERGIASVYISRDSVFKTEEARDLAHLLRAVAEPARAVLMRTAMATRLLGCSARDIQTLNNDEIAWEEKVLAFQEYHRIWNRYGFMPMFHTLLRKEGVIARLLSLGDGERRMTNLLQLAELAQIASVHHTGIEKLLRWLADERAAADGNVEDQQLRMESDEDLVQIVTIHKSKGLEYEVVFLPYIWGSRAVKDSAVVTYHDAQTRTVRADLGSDERGTAMMLAEKERLAEDLRLLYVALTRAKYRCYFSWGQFNGAADSALAYLLHQQLDEESGQFVSKLAELEDAEILRDLARLNEGGVRYLSIEELPGGSEVFTPLEQLTKSPEALRFGGDTRQSWHMTSFSGLTMGSAHGKEHRVELPDHDQVTDEGEQESVYAEALSPFTFPRGPQAGLFLHHLFENISFPDMSGEALARVVTQAMGQYGIDEKWHAAVMQWVSAILDTPLDERGGLRLRAIPDHKRLVELEFYFPVEGMNVSAVNALLTQNRGEGRQVATLDFAAITGLMKGFIDLIFEHDGRFYVLDYKSNHLGNRFEDYQPAQLTRATDGHYYDLQYLIYTLALHRYLKNRLPDYDYERHIGGVYYLFLRGMRPANGNRTGVYVDRPSLALIETLEQCFNVRVKKEVQCA